MKSKLNQVLLIVILLLGTALLAFNYGFDMGEQKGYVEAMQDCLEINQPSQGQTSL